MKRNLLIVDDDPEILEYIQEVLVSTDYLCMTATGFQQAVEMARDEAMQVDILLTDIIIPPFHGRDLANKIVRMQPKIKVLFMSGYPYKLLKGQGLLPPNSDLLPKPFTRFQLLHSLESVREVGPTWSIATAQNHFEY
ncbi:MAG: Sensory box histidine kinase/response regulator [Fibrobacteres bacterium]|nr:Sensory box histidine kinase/response regulator [Fibrobacterota bacterium]